METRNNILQELKDISPTVAAINSALPYQVPPGYFEGLAATILQRVKSSSPQDELESLSPLLSGLSKKMPFSVPEGYFGELSETVVGGVKAIDFVKSELQTLSPLMEELKGKNVYHVPAGYFDSLAGNVMNKIKKQEPAKVVSMSRRFMRYAAAAVIAGVIAIGGWFYFNNDATPNQQVVAAVEKISDDNKISDEEMSTFLENETMPVVINTAATVAEEMDASDVKEMLTDVTEDEMQQYLITL